MVRSINFNNHFGNKDESTKKSCTLKVENCIITNYKPEEGKPSGSGYFDLMVHGKYATYNDERFKCNRTLSMNAKKYDVFTTLAKFDGNADDLTQKDILVASLLPKALKAKCGIDSVKFNTITGKATLTLTDNQIICFDFETKAENIEKQKEVEEEISKFTGGNIDISKVHDIKTVAKYTGISTDYISKILVGIEGRDDLPVMEAYYDGVADDKNPIGHLTIGFGHTNNAGTPIISKETVITEKQAYQILANDILNAKKYIENKLGSLYTNAPKSIQDAMVDLVFNKGPGAIDKSLVANLRAGYLHSAARRTWYGTGNSGLIKRNIYRFISAVRDLKTVPTGKQSVSDAENAIKNFRNEHLTQLQNAEKEARQAWNDMCDNKKVPQYKVKV